MIIVVGLGPGGYDNIPPRNIKALKSADKVLLRTAKHPGVEELKNRGIRFESFDFLYEEYDDFDEIYERIVDNLIGFEKNSSGTVAYGVPGNPAVAEKSVELLVNNCRVKEIDVKLYPAVSGLEAVYAALNLDPTGGIFITDALNLSDRALQSGMPLLITQVYNRRVASDLKLILMDYYGDEHSVVMVRAAGVEGEEIIEEMPLFEIDRREWVDHLTSLYVPAYSECLYPLDPLVNVMDRLRGPEGCPWDREQTHRSLKRYLIEEAYEVVEAIEEGDMYKLREELGDLLLQVVFHARLAKEKGIFTINDVIEEITAKMIRRHPHVFKDLELSTAGEVKKTWEKIKKKEKKEAREKSVIDVPRELPALMRAEKIQAKASQVGFDWPDISGAWEKIYEELNELKEAKDKEKTEEIEEEFGDLLFAIVNCARFLKVDPEEALTATINKFIKRFSYIEQRAREDGRNLEEMSLSEMDKIWEEAKNLS